jgi:carboxypeptidase Taq
MTATATSSAPLTLEEHSAAYKELLDKLRTITHLNHASSVLNYDRSVFMSSSERTSLARGKQLAVLATIAHEKATDPQLGKLIDQATADLQQLSSTCPNDPTNNEDLTTAKRILELEKRSFTKSTCIPVELAAHKASLEASAYSAWVKARETDDFASFAPSLKDCFDTAKKIAELQRGDNKDIGLYSQMLDEFEMGMPEERIDALFQEVQDALVPFIAKIRGSENAPSLEPLKGSFPIDAQKSVSQKIVKAIGFDESHGRIDVSVHPFTMSLSNADVRITSRFSESEWYQGLAGSVHEAGHAMYEQHLGDSDLGLDSALSMGVHESQSLFWERHVGLSRPFYRWARPILTEAFGKDDKFDYSAEEIYNAVNGVDFENNLIRVEADELNYPLHVILRYNIERAVVAGELDVNDIPAEWNKSMKEFFAIDVPNDTKGCLQDIHWSCLVRKAHFFYMLFKLSVGLFLLLNPYFVGHWLLPNVFTRIHDGSTTFSLLQEGST